MSLEAAILAQVTRSPLPWERYPNIIDVETTASPALTTAGTYQTILQVNTAGYLLAALLNNVEYLRLRITVDSVVTELITSSSGGPILGLICASVIAPVSYGTNGSNQVFGFREPLSSMWLGLPSSLQFSSVWGQTTTLAQDVVAITPQPIQFNNLLKVEATVTTLTAYNKPNVLILGGHS